MYITNSRRDPAWAKRRDMSRSVLPSKSRRSAAAGLALAKRSARRTAGQRLGRLEGLGASDLTRELEELDLECIELRLAREVRYEVRARREADKLAPLVRWAVASTKDMRPIDRLPYLASVLPQNLIGAHALSHLRWEKELTPEHPCPWIG